MLDMINIYAEPISEDEIKRRRKMLSSISDKAIMYAPPMCGLEMIPLLAVAGVEYMCTSEAREALEYVHSASDRDWSGTDATAKFAEKVKASGRSLIVAEVKAMEAHLNIAGLAQTFTDSVANSIFDAVKKGISDAIAPQNPPKPPPEP